ncbi:MAG: 2-hydroxy-3-keto-5-methylthiopentenyl-1-phosphate phosphatase [Dehalococcoidia bacterium]|nr:2-hydroxy-3-keto-5-methylthiopentenyl-1-phosphate phosphatase [Dehalococcoidia bacterium]
MVKISNSRSVVFCDFDGTITTKGMIDEIGEVFVGQRWLELKRQMLARKLTLREGVAMAFETIPSSQKEAIVEHIRKTAVIREGFWQFMDFCDDNGIPLVVASGGFDFFVETVLSKYYSRLAGVYTIGTDVSGKNFHLTHTFVCDSCGLCKAKVMNEYPGKAHILVGDGLTDLHGAYESDLVFARAGLAEYLTKEGRAYNPYDTFFEVIDGVKEFLKSDVTVRQSK